MVVPFPVQQAHPEPQRTTRLTALLRLIVIGSSRSAQRREVVVAAPADAKTCTVIYLHDYLGRARSAS